MENCKCWPEVSLLNDEDAEYSPIEVWLYNFTSDYGASVQIRDRCDRDGILSTLRIHYCPFCGRFLG